MMPDVIRREVAIVQKVFDVALVKWGPTKVVEAYRELVGIYPPKMLLDFMYLPARSKAVFRRGANRDATVPADTDMDAVSNQTYSKKVQTYCSNSPSYRSQC